MAGDGEGVPRPWAGYRVQVSHAAGCVCRRAFGSGLRLGSGAEACQLGAGELTVSRALGDFQLGDLKCRSPGDGSFEGPLIAEPEVGPLP